MVLTFWVRLGHQQRLHRLGYRHPGQRSNPRFAMAISGNTFRHNRIGIDAR